MIEWFLLYFKLLSHWILQHFLELQVYYLLPGWFRHDNPLMLSSFTDFSLIKLHPETDFFLKLHKILNVVLTEDPYVACGQKLMKCWQGREKSPEKR